MENTRKFLASLALCALVAGAGDAMAYRPIMDDWLLEYPDASALLVNAANDCTLCHLPNTKNPRNSYGIALESMSFTQAEAVDSDGDGRTNGQEILIDGTLPGDAISADEIGSWGVVKLLFR